MTAIERCRTAALGGHVEQCNACGHQRIYLQLVPQSPLPKVPVPGPCRVVGGPPIRTPDHALFPRGLYRAARDRRHRPLQQRTVYDLLFQRGGRDLAGGRRQPQASGGRDRLLGGPAHLGPEPVASSASALRRDRRRSIVRRTRWIACRTKNSSYRCACSRVSSKGCSSTSLKQAFLRASLTSTARLQTLTRPDAFQRLLTPATTRRNGCVYAKPPFGGPEQVLKYLARYTHRVAISNNRLIALEDGRVTFRWKNYAEGNQQQTMTLTAVEFLRRFLLHLLLPTVSAHPLLRLSGQLLSRAEADARVVNCSGSRRPNLWRTIKRRGLSRPLRGTDRSGP